MGSTLGELKELLDYSLGTTETRLMDNGRRVNALNRAIKSILSQFDIEHYTISSTILFSNGIGSIPIDMLRPLYLKNSNNIEWDFVDYEKFGDKLSQTANIYYDTINNLQKVQIYPTSQTNLTFYYIQNPANLTDDSDIIKFNNWWDMAIAEKAAELLFMNVRNYNAAMACRDIAEDLIAKAWQNDRSYLTGRQTQKLTSVYSRKKLLREYSNLSTNYTAMSDNLTNLEIDTSMTAVPNYRYIVNSTSLVELTLPESSNINYGDIIEVINTNTGGWLISYNTDQYIQWGNVNTTTSTGYLQSQSNGDVVRLIYTGNNEFEVISSIGNVLYI